jgi:hypothetical protein
MTLPEEYRRCRACGALCDGDVCDMACELQLVAEREANEPREHDCPQPGHACSSWCGYCGRCCDCQRETADV